VYVGTTGKVKLFKVVPNRETKRQKKENKGLWKRRAKNKLTEKQERGEKGLGVWDSHSKKS